MWSDISLAIYGLREKDYYTASLFRRVAAAAWLGHGNKFDKFDKFWPDAKHKTIKPDSRALEQLRRFKLMEAEKAWQKD